ncbi:MAG: beta-propeller fold lactonase family protein [Acidobacteria bacterium]|nr:beta-propeller fold lactonase family protein [Acidobacteriota bacterium]
MKKLVCWSVACWLMAVAAGCAKEAPKPATKESTAGSPASTAKIPEWKSGYRVFVTNETTGDLSIIDGTTLEVIGTVALGKRPRGIHASPDGKTIYVALSGSPMAPPGVDESTLPPPDKSADGIGVYDIEQNKIVRILESGSDPENFDISHDGNTIFVSNEDAGGISFVDIPSGKLIQTILTGGEAEGVALAPDGKHVYSTEENDGTVTMVDVAARKKLKSFKVGRRPRNIIFMPDGKHAYVSAENDGTITLFDAVKNAPVKTIQLGAAGEIKPMGFALSPDASQLYVSTGRGKKIFVVDPKTNQVTGSFEVGTRPWGIALSPDGKTLFTANGPANDVSVVDVAGQTVTKKLKLTGSPWGVLVLSK